MFNLLVEISEDILLRYEAYKSDQTRMEERKDERLDVLYKSNLFQSFFILRCFSSAIKKGSLRYFLHLTCERDAYDVRSRDNKGRHGAVLNHLQSILAFE